MGVVGSDQIERGVRFPHRQIGQDSPDVRYAVLSRPERGRFQNRRCDVHGSHLPALTGEPDRFDALTAPSVQGRPRRSALGRVDHVRVRAQEPSWPPVSCLPPVVLPIPLVEVVPHHYAPRSYPRHHAPAFPLVAGRTEMVGDLNQLGKQRC